MKNTIQIPYLMCVITWPQAPAKRIKPSI